jgi:hypothetical protein
MKRILISVLLMVSAAIFIAAVSVCWSQTPYQTQTIQVFSDGSITVTNIPPPQPPVYYNAVYSFDELYINYSAVIPLAYYKPSKPGWSVGNNGFRVTA